MKGAIAGDIIGSVYEWERIKTKEFPLFAPHCRFTDDTVLTVAVAEATLTSRPCQQALHEFGRKYPQAGYGRSFKQWLSAETPAPYNSWGNGSAMRVSPIGFAFSSEDEVLEHARLTAEVTHNHPEGVKGAQAAALAVFLARTGCAKEQIRERIASEYDYDLNRTVDDIRPDYSFDVSCQGTVPEALIAFLDSVSYEDAVRNAVSLGGDSDTLACIAGGIAEAFYGGVPDDIWSEAQERLTPHLLKVVASFAGKYG
jgi:ADP-ribosylglycohydrolase